MKCRLRCCGPFFLMAFRRFGGALCFRRLAFALLLCLLLQPAIVLLLTRFRWRKMLLRPDGQPPPSREALRGFVTWPPTLRRKPWPLITGVLRERRHRDTP